jgi:hypothetical protein
VRIFFSRLLFARRFPLCTSPRRISPLPEPGGRLGRPGSAASSQKFNPPRCLLLKINYTCRAREITPGARESESIFPSGAEKIHVLLSSCISATAALCDEAKSASSYSNVLSFGLRWHQRKYLTHQQAQIPLKGCVSPASA